MKYANIFLAFFLFCLTNINSVAQKHQENNRQPYSIKIDSVAIVPKGGQFILQIFTRLLNNTNDTLKYFEYDCGTNDFLYYIDYHRMKWANNVLCLSTFVDLYTLAPHAARRDTLLIKRISSNKREIKFRLGCYIFINHKDYFHYMLTGIPKNAIKLWSKEIIWDDKVAYLAK